MEIYTIRDGYDNIIEAFIVKELAEAYLAWKFDNNPDLYFEIKVLETNDREYAEESYVGRELHYGAKIFLDIRSFYDIVPEGVSTRTSLKKIDTRIDVDTVCGTVSVYFEVDKETYNTIFNADCLDDNDFGKNLIQKAIDIYKKFKKDTE